MLRSTRLLAGRHVRWILHAQAQPGVGNAAALRKLFGRVDAQDHAVQAGGSTGIDVASKRGRRHGLLPRADEFAAAWVVHFDVRRQPQIVVTFWQAVFRRQLASVAGRANHAGAKAAACGLDFQLNIAYQPGGSIRALAAKVGALLCSLRRQGLRGRDTAARRSRQHRTDLGIGQAPAHHHRAPCGIALGVAARAGVSGGRAQPIARRHRDTAKPAAQNAGQSRSEEPQLPGGRGERPKGQDQRPTQQLRSAAAGLGCSLAPKSDSACCPPPCPHRGTLSLLRARPQKTIGDLPAARAAGLDAVSPNEKLIDRVKIFIKINEIMIQYIIAN